MLAEAQTFVREHWRLVAALAEQLLIDKTLDETEVQIVVDGINGDLDVDIAEALRQYRWLREK